MKEGKRMLNVTRGKGSPFAVYQNTVVKTIKTLTGDEITRRGNVRINVPESADEAQALMGADLWKWAVTGYLGQGKVQAANALLGVVSGGDKKLTRA